MTPAAYLLARRRWWATAAPARRLALVERVHTRAFAAGQLTPVDEDALIEQSVRARAELSADDYAAERARAEQYRALLREGGADRHRRLAALVEELTRPLLLDGWEARPGAWERDEGGERYASVYGAERGCRWYEFDSYTPEYGGRCGRRDTLAEAIVAAEDWLAADVQESAPSTDREQGTEADGG